jgi:surfeit locus 1 family protein
VTSAIRLLRERFRFTLIPTLFTVPALIVLIALGTWQIERLQWKTDLIARIQAGLASTPVAAPVTLDQSAGLDYHRVRLSGTFDHSKELYMPDYDARGENGWEVITPLILADGGIVLVKRGFVPQSKRSPATRASGQVEGETEIDGVLRLATRPTGWIVPENQPQANFWIYVDLPAMAAAIGVDPARLRPYYVEAGPAPNPGGLPIGGQTRVSLPNDHLQYAITWYGFAVTLLVIYFVYHYRKPEA